MNGIVQNSNFNEQDIREIATEIFGQNAYSVKGLKDAAEYIDNNNNYYQPGQLNYQPGAGYNSHFTNK